MSEDIKGKVGHLSPRVVIPVFLVLIIVLGLGLFFALDPQKFGAAADSVSGYSSEKINYYWPQMAEKFGIAVAKKNFSFEGRAIPDKANNSAVQSYLPQINQAAVIIYPVSTDKSRSNPGTPPVYVGKCIEIDLSTQMMFIWENGQLVNSWLISSGREDKPTKQGNFKVLDKMRWAYGSGGGDTWAMPYWLGFYFSGGTENGMHGLPLINGRKEGAGSLGHPVSHGCVRSGDANQEWLYGWADIGMPVIVHK